MKQWFVRLRALVPASIAARGGLLVLLVTVSVALPGFWAHWLLAGQARQRYEYERETYLAAALEAFLEYAPDGSADYDEWIERMDERGRRVRWAGIFDTDGTGLEFWRRAAMPRDQIVEQIDFGARTCESKPLAINGTSSQRFELLTVPQPDGVMLAVILDRGQATALAQRTDAARLLGMACLVLVGLGCSWAWFYYGIQQPILRTGRRVVAVQRGLAEAALDSAAPTELAGLARSAAELQEDLEKWRVEAAYWRDAVERTVDARTREATLAQRRAESQAETDPLTSLGNRRVLEGRLPELFAAQKRSGRELSLMVIDVDRFKHLNDTHGHQTGDELLAFLGDLIRATTRKGTDLAVRYGGDEFVIALPDTTMQQVCKVARRMVALFAQRARAFGPADAPGLSVGVAALQENAAGAWDDLLRMADEAMYRAKQRRQGVATLGDMRTA